MWGLKMQRVRTTVSSILTRKKDSADRPFIGPYVQQAMVGGAKLAPMMPLYGLMVWAMGDYEGLRQFLSSASSAEMSQTVLMFIVAGFALGGAVQVLVDASTPSLSSQGAWEPDFERTETEKWYWAQRPNGEEWAVREATTERCSPHIDVRWAMGDLIKELQRPENRTGSDFLDHKVMKLLGMQAQAQGLKPTQRLDDAKRLLELRYGGVPSRLEWDAKAEELPPSFKAYITVRVQSKAPAMEPEPWQRCLIADGPSEALAVTIAAITRETWTFKSQV
ncbi:TPA: hypothetical protein NHO12_004447 [Pseudomonas aeruginosa]|jgi:hypothetical protein|uniref:Uncharacterized protein n=1 Tax=Ectopseudomonas oleovorans TaxID=301 RepID=A0A379JZE2_ECTOL|nr:MULTISPECIES: hypothetical protein [Pseudomonadaceae]MBA1264911.1 hypothetical protein [Stutzerimonas stutzeri]MCO3921561.1 hypothetical protein [Pseudomonas aeruginosa]RQA86790.1 hypothetical protein IPC475_28845 [Pseudomonas aeruginosa]TXR38121.1 hypothetical protein FVE88_15965 [Pseudomonas mendocina]SUD57875.1 Uncharacterised protein [Pseudomonas oleovorans]